MYSLYIDKDSNIMIKHKLDIVELYSNSSDRSIEGNVYVGKIRNVVKGIQTAFVDICENKRVFLQYNINEQEKIKPNKFILLQIKKDAIGNKMPIATTNIKLTGQYVVLTPNENHISISKKIIEQSEVNRLKLLVNNEKLQYGVIIRTNAQGEDENVLNELRMLVKTWNDISENNSKDIKLVYSSGGFFKKLIKDLTCKNIEHIYVHESKKYEVCNILSELDFNIPVSITDIQNQIVEEIKVSQKRKVWLKSGGNIVIEKTEALTSIDVNSGSYTGKESLEDTVKQLNLEATREIIKQIRLRNLRGIIIIDYINMYSEEIRNEVLEAFKNGLINERAKVEVVGFTKLNLLEITRKSI